MATVPLLAAVTYYRFHEDQMSLVNELALFGVSLLMVLTGFSWRVKSTTFFGGGQTLVLYLIMIVVALGWSAKKTVGVYLAIGGIAVFAAGIGLSVYREKLLQLPERIAKRKGDVQHAQLAIEQRK